MFKSEDLLLKRIKLEKEIVTLRHKIVLHKSREHFLLDRIEDMKNCNNCNNKSVCPDWRDVCDNWTQKSNL